MYIDEYVYADITSWGIYHAHAMLLYIRKLSRSSMLLRFSVYYYLAEGLAASEMEALIQEKFGNFMRCPGKGWRKAHPSLRVVILGGHLSFPVRIRCMQ